MTWPEAVKLSVATGEVCVRLRAGNRALAVGSEAMMASSVDNILDTRREVDVALADGEPMPPGVWELEEDT